LNEMFVPGFVEAIVGHEFKSTTLNISALITIPSTFLIAGEPVLLLPRFCN